MSLFKAAIIDVDGTISNPAHRKHLIEKEKPTKEDWHKFFMTADGDAPNEWCITLTRALAASGLEIVFLTGRPEVARGVTDLWLRKHARVPFHLYMRPDGDRRHDTEVKTQIYRQDIAPTFDVLFAIDDRGSVVDMWRELGVTCLQCAPSSEAQEKEAEFVLNNDQHQQDSL